MSFRWIVRSLVATFAFVAFACAPRPSFVDDVPVDTGVVPTDATRDASDAALDARDGEGGVDGGCESISCNISCMDRGYAAGGACRATDMTCQCFGARDGGLDDVIDVVDIVRVDVVRESGVITCTTNDECPPTTFCNGPGCDAPGFCYPRGENDASACGLSGPPACGCDGMWYANQCARLASGARLNPLSAACGPAPMVDASTTE